MYSVSSLTSWKASAAAWKSAAGIGVSTRSEATLTFLGLLALASCPSGPASLTWEDPGNMFAPALSDAPLHVLGKRPLLLMKAFQCPDADAPGRGTAGSDGICAEARRSAE